MSENFCSFISLKKTNHVTKNAVLCVEERHTLADKRGDLIFLLVVRINDGISLLCVPAEMIR